MSDFDLRKFLAEQKAPKVENVKEESINEFSPEVVAVGAPLVMSLVAAGIGKLGFDKFMQALAKLPQLKGNKKFQDFVKKNASFFTEGEDKMEEGHDEMEESVSEGHDEMEEGVNEDVGAIIDFIMKNADKSVDWIKKNVKVGSMNQAMNSEAHDEMEEGHDEMEEGKEATEEEIKESAFKATINDILNS